MASSNFHRYRVLIKVVIQQSNLKQTAWEKRMSIQHNQIEWRCHPFKELSLFELYSILQLRQKSLVVEQHCPYLDADGQDDKAFHLMGFINDQLALYTRFYLETNEQGIIGRVIVKSNYRGRKLGFKLMKESRDGYNKCTRLQKYLGCSSSFTILLQSSRLQRIR